MSASIKPQRKKAAQKPDQFSFLFQNNPLPMWIYDLETLRFLEVNEAAVKHYGYSRAEFLRMRLSDIRPKEDVERLKAHVQTKRPRLQNSGEWRHLKKDGTIIYVDIISHKLIYKGHKAALIVANDITESKQTRSALKESQAEFSDVIATAMDAIIIIDDRQRIVVFNPAAEKMFQRSAVEVIGEPLSLVIPHRFRKSHQGYAAEFGKSGATKRSASHLGQFVGLRADGSEFPIEISISSVESSGQRRYATIVRDISERVRAEETLRENEERLRSLYQITSKLAAQSDVSSLLKMISDDVAALLDVPGGVVYLHDTQHAELEAVATTDPNMAIGMRIRVGEGMTGRIAQSRRPMTIDDYQTWDGAAPQYQDRPFYSLLGVPMLYGSELIGVLVAHGLHATSSAKEDNRKFTERDMRLLSLFASAAAGAVYSARLLESERKRRQEAETLQKATAALMSSLNLEQILNSLLDGLAQIVPFTSSAVLIDEGNHMRVVAGRGFADSEKAIGRLFPRKTSLMDEITRSHRPLIKKDVQADPDFSNWTSQVIRGWMGVPLTVRDKPIGYLTLDSDKPDFYNETHAEMAMAFANQAAAALENARLFQNSLQSTRRWATLHAASQELARISENLEQVYASIHNAASKLFPIEVFTIALLDDKRTSIDAVYLYDRGERSPAMNVPLGKGFSGRVIESGVSIKVDDDLESHPVEVDSVTFGSFDMARSILAVPLRVSDKIIGAMSIQSYEPHLYSSEDRLLLELLAAQAAIAIENARLLEETSRRAQEFKALVETTRDISTQQNNESLLQVIVERAAELLHCSIGGFYIYDSEHKEMVSTFFTSTKLRTGVRLKLGEGVPGQVALTREPIRIDDYQKWEGRPPRFASLPFRAVLGVPVLYGGELMGVLEVREYGESKRTFTQEDANLLSLFAAHAASVLHSANLFEQINCRVEELETMAQISLALRLASTRAEMLSMISEQLTSLLKADSTIFVALDPIEKELVIEQANGSIASLVGRRLKRSEGLFEYLIQNSERYVSADIRMSDQLANPQLVGNLRSAAVIPLIVQGEKIGLIGIGREEKNGVLPPAFTEREVSLLIAIGDMVANAIQRVSLHEETVRNNEQLIIVNQLGQSLTETLNTPTVYERLARSILDLLANTSTVYIFIYDDKNKYIRPVYAVHDECVLDVSKAVNIPLAKPEEGTLSQIIHTAEPMIINQIGEFYKNLEPGLLDISAAQAESALYVPIISSSKVLGVVQVQSRLPRRYTPSDARLLGLVANTAAVAMQNARLFDRLEERVEQFSTLHSIDLVIGSTTDLRVSLQVVLESIVHLLKVDAASILIYNPGTLNLEYAGGVGFHLDLTHAAVRLGDDLAGRAALTRQIIDVPELSKAELPLPFRQMIEHEGFISYRGLPLIAKGEVKGVLELYHRSAFPSNPEWNDLLNLLASQAAIAMDNAMLFNDLEHANTELELAYDATIEGWSQALELRDHATGGHTRRILETTITLAYKMGIPDSELPNMRRGVLLHDIGKMGVPDHILLKSSPLNEEEWEVMRQHPLNAYNLLSKIPYLRSALEIPYCHHEKWDSSGYPRGLKGEQIPLSARMFSVVDVYDALSYDRPYRSAWPKEKIVEYIKEQSGKYFDPRVVEAFLEIIQ